MTIDKRSMLINKEITTNYKLSMTKYKCCFSNSHKESLAKYQLSMIEKTSTITEIMSMIIDRKSMTNDDNFPMGIDSAPLITVKTSIIIEKK